MAQVSADTDRTRPPNPPRTPAGRPPDECSAGAARESVRVGLPAARPAAREVGLIRGYVGLVDQSSAGYPDNVFVRITLTSQQQDDLKRFESAVRKVPEVMECYLMSGDADYLLRVIVADARDYERVHSQHLTRLPGVDRVHSSFALRTVIKKTEIPVR